MENGPSEKHNALSLGLILVQAGLGVSFSLIAFTVNQMSVGAYAAVLILGLSLCLTISTLLILKAIEELRIHSLARSSVSVLSSDRTKRSILATLISQSAYTELYVNPYTEAHLYTLLPKDEWRRVRLVRVYVPGQNVQDQIEVAESSPIECIFFYESESAPTPFALIQLARSSEGPLDQWTYTTHQTICAQNAASFRTLSLRASPNPTEHGKPWLERQTVEEFSRHRRNLDRLSHSQLDAPSASEIELHQYQLSKGLIGPHLTTLHAVDMTPVQAWAQSDLSMVLAENIKAAKALGPDKSQAQLRRIFVLSNEETSNDLDNLAEMHAQAMIGCRVLRVSQIPPTLRGKLVDFAIYDESVAWIEQRSSQDRIIASGLFTADSSEIQKLIDFFEDLWDLAG